MVAAFVVREPSSLVDELLGYLDTANPHIRQDLSILEADYNLKLREDFAAPLGGEFAFALDGPILPTPSWKMIFEVYDPARLQQTFERVVEEVNKQAAREGKGGLLWELIERALKYRESGFTLLRSPRFNSTLPSDGNANFSAIFYHDLAPLLAPIAGQMEKATKDLPEEQRLAVQATADAPPTLAYAYAQNERIIFAADSEGGPFGLSPATLMGLPGSFEMQHILNNAMHQGAEVKTTKEK
jgi:hypothetical protein